MFIPSTTQLQLLTSRPEPRPIYDEAVFTGFSRATWLLARRASRLAQVGSRTVWLADTRFRTKGRGDCLSEAEARFARRPR